MFSSFARSFAPWLYLALSSNTTRGILQSGYSLRSCSRNASVMRVSQLSSVRRIVGCSVMELSAPRIVRRLRPLLLNTLMVFFFPLSCHLFPFSLLWVGCVGSAKKSMISPSRARSTRQSIFAIQASWSSTDGCFPGISFVFLKDAESFF